MKIPTGTQVPDLAIHESLGTYLDLGENQAAAAPWQDTAAQRTRVHGSRTLAGYGRPTSANNSMQCKQLNAAAGGRGRRSQAETRFQAGTRSQAGGDPKREAIPSGRGRRSQAGSDPKREHDPKLEAIQSGRRSQAGTRSQAGGDPKRKHDPKLEAIQSGRRSQAETRFQAGGDPKLVMRVVRPP